MTDEKRPIDHIIEVRDGWEDHLCKYETPLDVVARWGGLEELRKVVEMVEGYIGLEKESRGALLDAGCGSGAFLHEIKRRHPGLTLAGFDVSLEMIRIGIEILPEASLSVAEIGNIPCRDRLFDHVVCYSVLHYLPDMEYLEKTLIDIRRVMKPGARLVLGDVLSRDHMARCDYFDPEARKKNADDGYIYDDGAVFCPQKWLWLDPSDLGKLLAKLGFEYRMIEQAPNGQWGSPSDPQRFDAVAVLR